MAYPFLKPLLSAPNPAFLCKIQAARNDDRKHLVPLRHTLHAAASRQALERLRNLHPDPLGELSAFYAEHNGATLYACSVSGEYALTFFPIENIQDETESMLAWFDGNDELDDHAQEDSYGLRSSIAVARAQFSADYFAMPTTGKHLGSVFFIEHDCPCEGPLFTSFDDFVQWAVQDPLALIERTGLMAHYRDGRTNIHWQPFAYSPTGDFPSGTVA